MDDGSLITALIKDFVDQSPLNDMGFTEPEKIFDTPLVGFSSGADPLYDEYKSHIGPFYLSPLELFAGSFPGRVTSGTELTVVSWIIPSTSRTRKEQAAQDRYPSERWIRTRDLGEKFNNVIRTHVVEQLGSAGIKAVAPLLSMRPAQTGPSAMPPMPPASEPSVFATA
jgi:hypothetical protein